MSGINIGMHKRSNLNPDKVNSLNYRNFMVFQIHYLLILDFSFYTIYLYHVLFFMAVMTNLAYAQALGRRSIPKSYL